VASSGLRACGKGFHSPTFQLKLSCFNHLNPPTTQRIR